MKHLLTVLLILFSQSLLSQSMGYEMRTNGKSYIAVTFKGFELRHRSDDLENRFTYRHNFWKETSNLYLSVPLHYKIEKNEPTLEPRLLYKFPKFKLWIQKEFWFNSNKNAAIAIDYPYKDFTYRVGWDTSNTFRFRLKYKF
tara:strand:- start:1556 stop:1981 length:426 start_codon:yes stop_codon:yes gene_type:complete